MKKQVRLLIENIFNDLYDIDQENDLSIEIGDQIYKYNVGDIYYKKKKPYAICCGDYNDFKDKKSRFCLLNFNKTKASKWSKEKFLIKEFNSQNNYNGYIDENGYENTQIIKNHYPSNMFPIFNNCIKLEKNIYLPAIDELKILFKNNIQDKLNLTQSVWSSTQINEYLAYYITFNNAYKILDEHGIIKANKTYLKNCIPFIKID